MQGGVRGGLLVVGRTARARRGGLVGVGYLYIYIYMYIICIIVGRIIAPVGSATSCCPDTPKVDLLFMVLYIRFPGWYMAVSYYLAGVVTSCATIFSVAMWMSMYHSGPVWVSAITAMLHITVGTMDILAALCVVLFPVLLSCICFSVCIISVCVLA